MAGSAQQTKAAPAPGTVRTETVILVALLALAVGFVGGVAFGVYKAGGEPVPGASGGAAPRVKDDPRLIALQQEADHRPDDPEVWIRLGHLNFDNGDVEAAIEAYEKALALRPDNPDVITDLGVMYRRIGLPQKAVAAFDRTLALDPGHEIALFNKGIVLLHDLNDVDGALASWQRLLTINPTAASPGGQPLADLVAHVKTHQTGTGRTP